MGKQMELGTGAVAGAGLMAKYGLLAKLGAFFGASAIGAAVIAAYHPQTRGETWWRALGAGFGGVLVGSPACRVASHYVPWLFSGNTLDDLGVIATVLFIAGSLFWGFVGALQNLAKTINDKGANAVAEKIGLEDKPGAQP